MAIDPSLRPALDAFNTVKDKAAKELLDLQQTYEGQARLLSDFLKTGVEGATQRLAEIESKGTEAIPEGLRQDVLDAYNKLAQTIKDAPPELKPWVDPDGTQAMRAELTARASELIGGSGAIAGGTAAVAEWWASLSTVAAGGLVGVVLLALGGGAYLAFRQPSDVPQHNSSSEPSADAAKGPSTDGSPKDSIDPLPPGATIVGGALRGKAPPDAPSADAATQPRLTTGDFDIAGSWIIAGIGERFNFVATGPQTYKVLGGDPKDAPYYTPITRDNGNTFHFSYNPPSQIPGDGEPEGQWKTLITVLDENTMRWKLHFTTVYLHGRDDGKDGEFIVTRVRDR